MELTIEQALKKAVEAHKMGNLQDAKALYKAILQAQPKHPEANHNLGVMAVSLNKPEAALPLFKIALEANPSQGQFWLSYADALIKEKQFDNARNVLEQGKKRGLTGGKVDLLEAQLTTSFLTPSSELLSKNNLLPTSQQLKKVSTKKEKKKNVSRNLSKPKQIKSPPRIEINNLLEYFQKGQHDLALDLATALTQQYPNHPYGWKVLGALFCQTGKLQDSVIANQKVLEISPNDAEVHSNLGNTLKELGRLEDAETSYNKAIAIKPDLAEVHSNLGITLQELGRLEDAETCYKKAIAIKPDLAEAHFNLGNTLRELGRLEDAVTSYNKAIAVKPDDAEAFSSLSSTLLFLDKLNEASQVLLKIIEIDPEGFGLKACVNLAILNFLNGNRFLSKSFLLKSAKILENKKLGFKNEVAYWKLLSILLVRRQNEIQKEVNKLDIQKLYVIGESHSLASHETYIKTIQSHYLCQSFWIVGCKQWHIGNNHLNQYKVKLRRVIGSVPDRSKILLAIGEIDCRLNEGILKHIRNYPEKTHSELIQSTVENYLNYVHQLTTPKSFHVIIQGIPCPNIDTNNVGQSDLLQLVNLIREFNKVLQDGAKKKNFDFLDLHKLTDRGDGISNKKWHLDEYHISPEAMQEAWQNHLL